MVENNTFMNACITILGSKEENQGPMRDLEQFLEVKQCHCYEGRRMGSTAMQQEVGAPGPWGRESCLLVPLLFSPLLWMDSCPVLLSLQAPGMSQKWQHPSDPLDPFGQGSV